MEENNQVQPVSEQKVQEIPVTAKHVHIPRVFLVLVVSLLSAGIFGAAGYFLGVGHESSVISPSTSTTTKTATKTAPSVSPATTNLKTYVNSQYKFSLKYPSSWFEQQTKGSYMASLFLYLSPNANYFTSYIGPAVNVVLIAYHGSPQDWYKPIFNATGSNTSYVTNNLTINGYQAFYVKQTTSSFIDEEYAISNGNNYLLLIVFRESETSFTPNNTVNQTNNYGQYIPEFKQIVNSVKFND